MWIPTMSLLFYEAAAVDNLDSIYTFSKNVKMRCKVYDTV